MVARTILAAALFASTSLAGAPVRADVVGPAPMSCPPGSTPTSSHAGPLCSPTGACITNAECTMGGTCMEVFQCVETRACGGRIPPDSGPCTVSHVVGACGAGNTCSTGTCFTRRVCSTTSLAPSSGGCACAIGARSLPGSGGWLAITVLSLVALHRRARSGAPPRS